MKLRIYVFQNMEFEHKFGIEQHSKRGLGSWVNLWIQKGLTPRFEKTKYEVITFDIRNCESLNEVIIRYNPKKVDAQLSN